MRFGAMRLTKYRVAIDLHVQIEGLTLPNPEVSDLETKHAIAQIGVRKVRADERQKRIQGNDHVGIGGRCCAAVAAGYAVKIIAKTAPKDA